MGRQVAPPEPLRILWLVHAELCEWTLAREVACSLSPEEATSLLAGGGAANFEGLDLDPSAGVVHHLSYVRTDR